MNPSGLRSVVENERTNAVLCWLLVVLLVGAALAEFAGGDLLQGLFVLSIVGLAVLPPAAFRTPLAMLPWEVVAVASIPAVSQALVVGQTVGGVTLTGRVTNYVAVAAVALIVAVEIDVFTPVKMSHSFAVLFTAITTTAAAGVWAVAQWLSDVYLGTAFLFDGRSEHAIEEALMWDFVAATVAGILAGVVFDLYFRRRAGTDERVPREVRKAVDVDPDDPAWGTERGTTGERGGRR